eukprot:1149198-Pelagomonas_calceolata.AAC.3
MLHIYLGTGCAGWPKQGFGQAPERRPGHPSSSSQLALLPCRSCTSKIMGQKWRAREIFHGARCYVLCSV